MTVVLDASAVIAFLRLEPGADAVQRYLDTAKISAVNLAEVITKLVDFGMEPSDAVHDAKVVGLAVVPFDDEQAALCGRLRLLTRNLGLSLGDRACIALALSENARLVTADRVWSTINLPLQVELIRP